MAYGCGAGLCTALAAKICHSRLGMGTLAGDMAGPRLLDPICNHISRKALAYVRKAFNPRPFPSFSPTLIQVPLGFSFVPGDGWQGRDYPWELDQLSQLVARSDGSTTRVADLLVLVGESSPLVCRGPKACPEALQHPWRRPPGFAKGHEASALS